MVAPDLIVEASETQPLLHSSPPSSTRHSQKDEDSIIIEDVSLRNEARILLRYSGPLVLTYFLQYAYQVIIIVVAAQLSTAEIAGVSLGITTSNITGFAVFE
jgi:MATE family multidrug resistance protein